MAGSARPRAESLTGRNLALAALVALVLQPAGVVGQSQQQWALPIPRVTSAELAANSTLRSGLHAYVLIDWATKWKSSTWTLDYLKKKIPFEWVDFYPKNMRDVQSKPYLLKFEDALPQFQQNTGFSKYMQLRLGRRGWNRLRKDFDPKPLPEVFWDDDEWIGNCMKSASTGQEDKKAVDNFFTTQQWKFLLIGQKGTEMFFHQDGTAASTWQVQLTGRKKWTLCPHSETPNLDVHIDTLNPDYQKFPRFAQALCGRVTVMPGEILYYPAYWWHHPVQFDTPSIAYTGALVGVESDRNDLQGDRKPHLRFYKDILNKCSKCWEKGKPERKCDDISEKWPGAAPPIMRVVCEEYIQECYKDWDTHSQSLHGSGGAKSEL